MARWLRAKDFLKSFIDVVNVDQEEGQGNEGTEIVPVTHTGNTRPLL